MAITNYFDETMLSSGGVKQTFTAIATVKAVTGTAGADKLISDTTGHVLAGGAGNDTYIINSVNDVVIEKVSEGVDTIQVMTNTTYTMADNVENGIFYGKSNGIGNGLANVMTGSGYGQTLEGGGGNDVLTGKAGADIFVFKAGSGYDVITDFVAEDKIRISDYGVNTFAKAQAAMTQDGADVVLKLSSMDAVRLSNVKMADLKAENFQFGLDPSNLALTFSDEFNSISLYNAATQTGTWRATTKSDQETSQAYVDPNDAKMKALGINPLSVKDGVLSITATRTTDLTRAAANGEDYTSARITTQDTFYQKYGYFEMRAALPQGQGAWPAFWLLPAGGASSTVLRELDVMEQIANGFSHQAAHYAGDGNKRAATSFDTWMGDTSGFHTYGMLWTETEIAWYIDGVEVNSMATPADLNQPMYLIANLAMGGSWAGAPDLSAGDQTMQIDYIRAYAVDSKATSGTVNASHPADAVKLAAAAAADNFVTRNGLDTADDRLYGTTADDRVYGLGGNDTLNGSAGSNLLDGGAGNDTASYRAATEAVDLSLAKAGAQAVGDGFDTLVSIENLEGSMFGDVLAGDSQANTLSGLAGADVLIGGDGDDILSGGVDDDVLDGGAGNDVLDGAAGIDTATYETATAAVVVSLALTTAQKTGGAGIDTLSKVENLVGSAYGDTLTGSGNANTILGGGGADRIDASGGNDLIDGGAGADILTGGGGNDVFAFSLAADSSLLAFDIVTDFKAGADLFDLSAIDANILLAGDQAFTFVGTAGFSKKAGELTVGLAKDGMHIAGDIDGDGVADFHVLLTNNTKSLVASDFIL